MNKLFTFLFTMMFLIVGCSDDDRITGGVTPEPELLGCEAATTYDWNAIEFETSLEGGADTWIAFSLEELTLFTVVINQAGFQCTVYNGCEGEVGLDPPLFQFETMEYLLVNLPVSLASVIKRNGKIIRSVSLEEDLEFIVMSSIVNMTREILDLFVVVTMIVKQRRQVSLNLVTQRE